MKICHDEATLEVDPNYLESVLFNGKQLFNDTLALERELFTANTDENIAMLLAISTKLISLCAETNNLLES